ncbi:hypothetical protein TNIN_128751 [Trichonephila inaurata madagascariensis]|uniref:Uncharacterized protein n=1 Tax=Trichonephila inaurata madagascariensis TaxID=2747483 RepID=A0A8X6YQ87_9ARAC|nr:hypothetical protein TNIN_128751 [Trichonephila inaurata madagascariensis]
MLVAIFKHSEEESLQRELRIVRSRRTTGPARPQGQVPVPRVPYFEPPQGASAALELSIFQELRIVLESGNDTKYSQLVQKEGNE